jgi:predicted CXXCH cytochrome family protein
MSDTARIFLRSLLILTWTMFSATAQSAKESTTVPKLAVQQASQEHSVSNPHWQADACNACHTRTPTGRNLYLRSQQSDKLCNDCHESISAHSYIHPVGMRPDAAMLRRMPRAFRNAIKVEKGRVGCRTCHDLTMTCLPNQASKRYTNPRFFRNGPYKTRTDLCYLCHDSAKYKRLNPHDQLDRAGKIKEESCLVCHKSGDKLKTANGIEQVDFNVDSNLSKMCTGCHLYEPHPGGSFSYSSKGPPNHLVKPNKRFQKRTGEIFCGTCHNPHQKGVIKTAAAARGAGSKQRLRMQQMCANCHDK